MARIQQLMSLANRTAVITGGAGHIGRHICKTFVELGADVIVVDYPEVDFAAMTDDIGAHIRHYACDLERGEDRDQLVKKLVAEQNINILVNNAAFVGTRNLSGWNAPFEEQSTETWRRAVEVNLTAAFDLIKGLTPTMRRSAGASIINVGSIYGILAPDYALYEGTTMGNAAAYAASKGGLLQLTRWLSTTLAPEIRVNAITPGGVFRSQNADFVARYVAKTPLRRMAREEDFCGAIAYLASDLSTYVTGHNLVVDGGWSAW